MLKNFKSTLINGVLFLVPVTLFLIIILKLYEILLKVAKPLGDIIPLEKIGGVAIANLLVIVLVIILCYIMGLLSEGKYMKMFQGWIENKVLIKIPGYTIIQGFTADMQSGEKASKHFKPVLVKFDDQEQMCFEIERIQEKKVVVYVPGAPSPWSGSVVYVDLDRVVALDISVAEATKNLQRLGIDSEKILL